MINIPIDITSIFIGLSIGIPLGAFLMHRYMLRKAYGNGVDGEKVATVNLMAILYTMVWVYWHLQAAQGLWTGVPTVFDAMGGVAAGITLGIDASAVMGFIGKILSKRDNDEEKKND